MLYFSYGSNMSLQRLNKRIPSACIKSIATLSGYDLRFHKKGRDGSGKCDAYQTHHPEHFVIGVVFEMTETEKLELDRIEGVGCGYANKQVTLVTPAGEIVKASTYCATNIGPRLQPYHWYKHHVLTGAREHGLPEEYVAKIRDIPSIADTDSTRHDGEMAVYCNKSS